MVSGPTDQVGSSSSCLVLLLTLYVHACYQKCQSQLNKKLVVSVSAFFKQDYLVVMNVFLMFFLLSINEYIFVQSLWDTNTTKKKWPLLL